ncbi:MAG: hypothetical protein ACXABY_20795 [Candidatus Thorarchaeota archaeon]|jgi:hypothetical protein
MQLKRSKKVKAPVVKEVVKEAAVVAPSSVTVHLDRDPNDPRVVRDRKHATYIERRVR